jgi:two-component system NarL family response regulator
MDRVIRVLIAEDQLQSHYVAPTTYKSDTQNAAGGWQQLQLSVILETHRDIEVAGVVSADSIENALYGHRPDVLVLSLPLLGLEKTDTARLISRVTQQFKSLRVIAIAAPRNDDLLIEAIKAGAHAQLRTTRADQQVVQAVRDVSRGDVLVNPGMAQQILNQWRRRLSTGNAKNDAIVDNRFSSLTHREIDVLKLIGVGMTNTEISEQLFLSEGTVKNYVTRIMTKLAIKDRTKLAIAALRHGLSKLE